MNSRKQSFLTPYLSIGTLPMNPAEGWDKFWTAVASEARHRFCGAPGKMRELHHTKAPSSLRSAAHSKTW